MTGDTEVRLQRIAGDDAEASEAVVRVLRDGFFTSESCCMGCEITRSPVAVEQLCLLVRVALRDGASVGLYCGGRMVAVSVNKVQVPPAPGELSFFELFRDEHATDPRAHFLMNFMLDIDAREDLFGALGEGRHRLMEVMFLGTSPSHRGRGFGRMVVEESLAVARGIGVFGVSAIFTSDFSAAIGRKLGFKEMAVVEHSDFTFDGKTIDQRLPPHQQRSRLVLFEL